jgi:tRNA(fMet)-specific endonuclease VapC
MEDILIDTDIVIEYLRSRDKSSTELIELLQEHYLFISAISEFELYLGARTAKHEKDLESIFNEVEIIAFDSGCGKIAADIWKALQLTHQNVEIKDIFIASIAIRNDVWLRTFNEKHFKGIEKLKMWKGDQVRKH